jgi:GT2 family glycosyltransferase
MTTGHPALSVSVLVPSRHRPDALARCLRSLAGQTRRPDEVIVIWQGDDTATRDRATQLSEDFPSRLEVLHQPEVGVVPAENLGLEHATGSIIALIDDDAVAPPEWLARHLAHFDDPAVGAVGGPYRNYHLEGAPFPARDVEPTGRFPWHGQPIGNLHDHPEKWRSRRPTRVDHLVGNNMLLRRAAFDRFEPALRCYWQMFELEVCLQVRSYGYRVLFDYGNAVEHYPTNTAFVEGRGGDLAAKIYNPAYNLAFIHAKHSPWVLMPLRAAYQLFVGRVNSPGLLACFVAVWRYGGLRRELRILVRTWAAVLAGWWAGLCRRMGGQPGSAQ